MSGPRSAPQIPGLALRNPVLTAAGCGGTGRELAAYTPLDALGAFTTRTITLNPRPGGPVPRVVETPSGLVHSTGCPNPGLEGFLATELPPLVQAGARVVVSVAAASVQEYADLVGRLSRAPGIAAVEVNLSAPDAAAHGLFDVREPFHITSVLTAVLRELPPGVPVLAKLRPDVLRVVEAARTAAESGAVAVVVGGPQPAALPDGRAAGLSGPAIRPLALRCVTEVRAALPSLPVIGAGGIATAADAREFLRAGATAVQLGTALLHDPTTAGRLVAALASDGPDGEDGEESSAEGAGSAPAPPARPARPVQINTDPTQEHR
ncbi:dihydroorotate dehydrogenase [Nocardioides sp. dk4132]|uniref:nitronate monooxygenase n=1 Tax=unclassified Nocardioides TaxID=2615069 RepID=UPI001297A2C2|nr:MULTISPECIES: nitronate monooxygenase [unclassified Nocardioides]MQW76266.1 dihydroorotate dehydrogenase [Nocardioides sp. dk4132]QGA07448.1 dihydroorotate dehydrogenase [Nocardioides sp. dk884]